MGLMQLMVQLGLNATGFETGLKQAKSGASAFGNDLSSNLAGKLQGIFGLAAIEEMTRKTIDYGSKVQDLSNRLGISTDAVQQWDFAMQQNGGSIEQAASFFEKLAVSREKALKGSGAQIEAFQRLGVSIDELKNKRLEDIAASIAQAFEGGDPQALIAPLREVGGKAAGAMVAAFRDGLSDALKEAPLASEETIASLDRADDAMKKFAATMRVAWGEVLGWIQKVWDLVDAGIDITIGGAVGALSGLVDSLRDFNLLDLLGSKEKLFASIKDGALGGMQAAGDKHVALQKEREDKAARRKEALGKPVHDDDDEPDKKAQKEAEASAKKSEAAAVAEASKVLRLREQIAEIRRKSAMDGMRDGEKEIALAKEIAGLRWEAEEMRVRGFAESEVMEVEKTAADREAELAKLQHRPDKRPESNALRDIGNFLGGAPDRTVPDKLDVLHADMQKLITQGKDGGPPGLNFPTA